jgi:hypothetical protein
LLLSFRIRKGTSSTVDHLPSCPFMPLQLDGKIYGSIVFY